MPDKLTPLSLVVLSLLAFLASGLAVGALVKPARFGAMRRLRYSLLGSCTLGCIGLFVYRLLATQDGWQPLGSHVDGLVLIASLFAVMALFLQSRGGIAGLTTFALPVLTVVLAWAVCASAWTFQPFQIDSVWEAVHRLGVYLGTLFFLVAATAGAMFLYAQRGLTQKRAPVGPRRLPSLEAIERLIVGSASMGFALLSLGLVVGLIIVMSGPTKLGRGWWYSPKVVLAGSVWLIYALVMNIRYATAFRGARAAWLSILGLVLLLATFGVVNAMPDTDSSVQPVQPAHQMEVL